MRIDQVYKQLLKSQSKDGISAQEVADILGCSRPNVSHDLNKLVQMGKVTKKNGKPVLFRTSDVLKELKNITIIEKFSQDNPSLYAAVEQAKAAVLYPPNGMNILILGDTGVGKSMFAELLYDFAKDNKLIHSNSTFTVFNCADYANNPQLLLAQLFGSKKGAYTGLDENRVGLIESSDNGILFLDEVHRLPPEGQEMFFTFIDKGTYRRMGETDVLRRANVRIFAATTEKPESHLLRTFTRRFPMIIRIPSLKERTFSERVNLVNYFINAEAKHLNYEIRVSANSLNALMTYPCENNIGQLLTDIKFACANAYADYISGKRDHIRVISRLLPEHVKSTLFDNVEHRNIYNNYIPAQTKFAIYHPNQSFNYTDDVSENTIYDTLNKLVDGNNEVVPDVKYIDDAISEFFKNSTKNANKYSSFRIENLIDGKVLSVTEDIILNCENILHKKYRAEFKYALAKHIEGTLDRVKANQKIYHPNLNQIRLDYPKLFNLALDSLRIMERQLELTLPIDEAGFLVMILLYDEVAKRENHHTKIIVVMHGESAASSISDTANQLMGVDIAQGFDLPLDVKPQIVVDNIVSFIQEDSHVSEVLLMVDMGSLVHIGQVVEEKIQMKTMTVQLVSTLHVIEAVQKSIAGLKVNDIYNEVLNVSNLIEQKSSTYQLIPSVDRKLAILTICTSGQGTAVVLKNMIEKSFSYRKNYLDVIPVEFSNEIDLQTNLKQIQHTHTVIAAISPLSLSLNVNTFDADFIATDDGISKLQRLIDIETTSRLMYESLSNILSYVSPEEVIPTIRMFIENCANELSLSVTSNMVIGITMHMACLIDRLCSGLKSKNTEQIEDIPIDKNLHDVLVKNVHIFSERHSVYIDDYELRVIAKFFKNKIGTVNEIHKANTETNDK
ncbi:sigma-54-dependent transcriptional regulator [Vibrio quintilis]|uniref:sigma-54-dependent transcriptional regulator n=1 Tax=Vibrio quintilis TaxID=1117707 RepID=UPI0021C74097|nr:sigma-54-dependent transcriptional regulator [Vibrio quintilis]